MRETTGELIDHYRREIAAVEVSIRNGHPKPHALAAWSAELRILLAAQQRKKPPGLNPAA